MIDDEEKLENNGKEGSEIFKPVAKFLREAEKMSFFGFQISIEQKTRKSDVKIFITPEDLKR